jgi:hypothetical protein
MDVEGRLVYEDLALVVQNAHHVVAREDHEGEYKLGREDSIVRSQAVLFPCLCKSNKALRQLQQ